MNGLSASANLLRESKGAWARVRKRYFPFLVNHLTPGMVSYISICKTSTDVPYLLTGKYHGANNDNPYSI